MPHDFVNFPELTALQMEFYYFESPHKQIFGNFMAKVVKVHDGDTITLRWSERNFDFPLRFIDNAAPELSEEGGQDSRSWLENQVLNEEVEIIINPDHRVEKWGRLLGGVFFRGLDIGQESILAGKSRGWDERKEGVIMDFNKEMIKIWS